jgi:alkyl hydroperoxide reductase subunit F
MGHEFTSLVLALLQVGGYPPKVEQALLEQIRALDGDFEFEVYVSLTCHNCPDVVQALNLMAIQNPRIKTTMIEGGLFQDEIKEREIMGVPTVFLNGTFFDSGRMSLEEILAKIDTSRHRARGEEDRRQGPVRRADRRRRPRGRRGRRVRGPQGHPHRRRFRALRRPGAGHAGHRELHLGQGDRGPEVRAGAGGARAHYDVDIMNLQRAKALKKDDG